MIGAFAAFGVTFDLAVLAVLSYRAISFWLPTIPGGVAYFQLRKTVAQWKSEQSPSVRPGPAVAGLGSLQVSGAGTLCSAEPMSAGRPRLARCS